MQNFGILQQPPGILSRKAERGYMAGGAQFYGMRVRLYGRRSVFIWQEERSYMAGGARCYGLWLEEHGYMARSAVI